MKTSEAIAFGLIALVGTYVVTHLVRDRLRKRRAVRSLATRPQYDEEAFARAHFPNPKQADIAVRARRVLANNLNMPLKGLSPTDRLNDDLNAELEMNPNLFWELEDEFAIKTGIDDLETFEKTLQRIVTFEDLVKFLEEKISSTPPNAPSADEEEESSRIYQCAIRAIPVLCIAGFAIVIIGIFARKESIIGVGAAIFLSGIAIWGLANGGELLRGMIHTYRAASWKDIAAHPWWLMFQLLLLLFFLWFGSMIIWVILKGLLAWP